MRLDGGPVAHGVRGAVPAPEPMTSQRVVQPDVRDDPRQEYDSDHHDAGQEHAGEQ
jgi:hypothetical protein